MFTFSADEDLLLHLKAAFNEVLFYIVGLKTSA